MKLREGARPVTGLIGPLVISRSEADDELLRLTNGAPGQPHSNFWAGGTGSEFGVVYAGR